MSSDDNTSMLKSLSLRNFQVHRTFKLALSPEITTIVGSTDAGKSAVLRALRWICLNHPFRDFIHHGTEFAYGVLKIEAPDGSTVKIVRRRGQENVYKMNGRVFKAFGTGIPEPIAAVLGVNEINFQKQHDSPFWFGESAPEVSRQLNRVIDLSVIDSSLSKSAAGVRTARERICVAQERLSEKEQSYELLAKAETNRVESFTVLRETYAKLRRAEKAYDQLGRVLDQFDSYPLEKLERQATGAGILLEKAAEASALDQQILTLSRLILLSKAAAVEARSLPDFSGLEAAWAEYSDVEGVRIGLAFLLSPLVRCTRVISECDETAEEIGSILAKQQCPLCGRKNQQDQ